MNDDVAPGAIIAAKQQLRISGINAGLFMRRKAQFRRPRFVEPIAFIINAQYIKHRLRISCTRRKFCYPIWGQCNHLERCLIDRLFGIKNPDFAAFDIMAIVPERFKRYGLADFGQPRVARVHYYIQHRLHGIAIDFDRNAAVGAFMRQSDSRFFGFGLCISGA